MTRKRKIAENNVEVTPSMKTIDVDGNDVEIWDEDNKKWYGWQGIRDHKALTDKKLADAQAINPQEYKDSLIARRQKEVDKISALRIIIPFKTVTNVNDNSIEIFDTAEETHAEMVNDISTNKKLLAEAKSLDENLYKNYLVTKAQKEVDEITDIQKVMDGK